METVKHTFRMQINPEPKPPTTSFTGLSHSGPPPLCPNYPRAGYQRTRDISMPQSPPILFKLANPKRAYLPCLAHCPPRKQQWRLLPTFSPCFLYLLTDGGASLGGPQGVWCPLFLGTEKHTILNSSCLLFCWCHYTWIIIKPTF